MYRIFIALFPVLFIFACSSEKRDFPHSEPTLPLKTGIWRLTLEIGNEMLPVNFQVRNESGLKVDIINAEERITIYEFIQTGDSLRLRMPLFDSEFLGVVSSDRSFYSGVWRNYARPGKYEIPFEAEWGLSYRFCETNNTIPPPKFPSRYRVEFSPEKESDMYPALGLFETTPNSNRITGTFITETGDYRYLEGNFCGSQLLMSCFDGSHAFYFSAQYQDGYLMNGQFKSGTHWSEPWTGIPDKDFELSDPNSLTSIVDSSAIWRTTLFTDSGEQLSLDELGLNGKVSIIQILGTWCPNCIDETIAYQEFYDQFHERGLEIIPVAFESTDDPSQAFITLNEFKRDLNLQYPIYFGGKRGKTNAAKVFPALDHVMSYPTSIIIGRDGSIIKVHTGFYGPGTGLYFDTWSNNMVVLLDSLLNQS